LEGKTVVSRNRKAIDLFGELERLIGEKASDAKIAGAVRMAFKGEEEVEKAAPEEAGTEPEVSDEYDGMTRKDLYELAQGRELPVTSGMKKGEMIAALREADAKASDED
jgi:hypothetical protein